MHNLVIDIGNTYSKVAIFKHKELIHYQRFAVLDEGALGSLIDQFHVKNGTISSVNQNITELISFLKNKINYISFSTKTTAGVKNHYETLATLGLDRWAKVIAAHCLYNNQSCLIIDAGTCITYDVVTAKGEYFGGSISLGINMRFKALNYFTGRLPLVKWNFKDEIIPLGNNTENALKSGVLQGVINEIEGFIGLENKKYRDLIVILTGGDADFLNKQLKNSIFASQIKYDQYLVLKGLNEVITL